MTEPMGAVLGANVMRDHNVVFDYDNHRVGFAEGMCDYSSARFDDKRDKTDKKAVGQVRLDWILFRTLLVAADLSGESQRAVSAKLCLLRRDIR